MSDTTLAPVVSVHPHTLITPDGVVSLVEFRFEDYTTGDRVITRFLVNAKTAKQVAASAMLLAYNAEPEDDRA